MTLARRLAHAAIPTLHRAGNAPPGHRWPNRARRVILPRLDPLARRRWNRPLVRDKTGRREEHVATIDAGLAPLERALASEGFSRAVVSTLKYLDLTDSGRVYESAAWALHRNGWQLHVYVFDVNGRLHIYAHREPSYLSNPEAHEGGGNQEPGDPGGLLEPVLEAV